MADIAWSDVTAIDAALSAVAVAAQDMFLDEANALRPTAFDGTAGPRFKLARALLAAHRGRRWVDTAASGAAGPVTSEDVGGMATSYAAPSGSSSGPDDFHMTAWGQQYAAMCRNSPRARLGVG
jgi:type II secretory pathway pseudopilin PulG